MKFTMKRDVLLQSVNAENEDIKGKVRALEQHTCMPDSSHENKVAELALEISNLKDEIQGKKLL